MKKTIKKGVKKILLIIIVLLILLVISLIIYKLLNNNSDKEDIKVVDSIENYGYNLDDRDSALMKSKYEELKKVLNSDEINYEEYAKILSELFVIDLFTMNNKINKYDVGSVEYVYTDSVDNFKLNVEDTIYKHMENNSDGKRKQELPEVKSIEVVSINSDEFEIDEESYESFVVDLDWNYVKDLSYDNTATITLINLDNKLYVVEYLVGE
ncbi:MAG: hypothetical protein ACLUFU_06125 [Bacilli bacterium]